MDMAQSTSVGMAMGGSMMPTATTTAGASMASSTGMSMGGMGGGSACKISMLWNWYTVDSCFISSTWRVTSEGAFAGSCIGVVLLVVALEFLRRATKEFDRYLVRKHAAAAAVSVPAITAAGAVASSSSSPKASVSDRAAAVQCASPASLKKGFRPSVFEQAIRAFLHMVQFAVAYFIMLLAMYYNGYIIICIFIGAYLGAFIFQWETLGAGSPTSAASEATVCCG